MGISPGPFNSRPGELLSLCVTTFQILRFVSQVDICFKINEKNFEAETLGQMNNKARTATIQMTIFRLSFQFS